MSLTAEIDILDTNLAETIEKIEAALKSLETTPPLQRREVGNDCRDDVTTFKVNVFVSLNHFICPAIRRHQRAREERQVDDELVRTRTALHRTRRAQRLQSGQFTTLMTGICFVFVVHHFDSC